MATRAPSTRVTTTVARNPRSSWPSRRSSRRLQEIDEPPAPQTGWPRRDRTPNGPRRRMAQEPPLAALGFGPQRRPAAGTPEPGDEPDVDGDVGPLLARPGRRHVDVSRRWIHDRPLEVASGAVAKKKGSIGSALTSVVGGALVGLDEQLLRSTPRAEILVKRGNTVRGTSAQGGTLLVGLPDDPILLGDDRPGEDGTDARTRAVVATPGSTEHPGE